MFLIVLVDVFGLTLVLPLLAIYAESFHATALQCSREHRSARPVIAISGQSSGWSEVYEAGGCVPTGTAWKARSPWVAINLA